MGRSETVSCVDPSSVIIAVDVVDCGCCIEVSDDEVVVFPKELFGLVILWDAIDSPEANKDEPDLCNNPPSVIVGVDEVVGELWFVSIAFSVDFGSFSSNILKNEFTYSLNFLLLLTPNFFSSAFFCSFLVKSKTKVSKGEVAEVSVWIDCCPSGKFHIEF